MKQVSYRTECNQRSKYFTDIADAYIHVYVCMAKRKSVELWLVEKTAAPCGVVKAVQTLIDSANFNKKGEQNYGK